MTDAELEAWASKILDQVRKHAPVEDSRVELKRTWIDPRDAARRLAGQANAVRSDVVLWLIGVDERAGTVGGAQPQEVANWLPAVKKYFDTIAPELVNHVNLDVAGAVVVALLFDTRGTPYVVKTLGGEVTHEVPWREGTHISSATRAQLLRLLSRAQLPQVEVGSATLSASGSDIETGFRLNWSLMVDVHLIPANDQPLIIRQGDCRVEVSFAAATFVLQLPNIALMPEEGTATVQRSVSQLVITGPAALKLIGMRNDVQTSDRPAGLARVRAILPVWQAESPLTVSDDLAQQLTGQPGAFRWTNGRPISVFP